MSTLELDQKDWSCPKKLNARDSTIINAYKDYTGFNCIPEDKQYWTLCGQCANSDGTIGENSEYDQLVNKNKFVKPKQFFGIEKNKKIYKVNTAIKEANWICGDFVNELDNYAGLHIDKFNPAVINFDTIKFPYNSIDDLANILDLINILKLKNVMIVYNTVLRAWFKSVDVQAIITALEQHPLGSYSWIKGNWKLLYKSGYVYNGTGKSGTKMGTICIVN